MIWDSSCYISGWKRRVLSGLFHCLADMIRFRNDPNEVWEPDLCPSTPLNGAPCLFYFWVFDYSGNKLTILSYCFKLINWCSENFWWRCWCFDLKQSNWEIFIYSTMKCNWVSGTFVQLFMSLSGNAQPRLLWLELLILWKVNIYIDCNAKS